MTTHRKPSGTSGYFHVTGDKPPEFNKLHFPEAKDEIEKLVVAGAIAVAQVTSPELYEMYGKPTQNPENHFDFSLKGQTQDEFLDLAEIVGPKGYASDGTYVVGEYVDRAFELIKKKAKKYGLSRKSAVHLLLYTTDWRYFISESAVTVLRAYCGRRQHHFKSIAYFAPSGMGDGALWQVYPAPSATPELGWIAEHQLRGNKVTNFDPASAQPLAEGGGLSFTMPTGKGS